MDEFNNAVRRVANLLAYEQPIDADTPRMVLVAAQLFNSWIPFDMPVEPLRFSAEASGEFTAR